MKLWHDDIRIPPDETWTWARTNAIAKIYLESGKVTECSLDHDHGLEELDPYSDPELMAFAGRSPAGTGADLVMWMILERKVPVQVRIHSWNPIGAAIMANMLNDAGYNCVVAPYGTF